MLGCHLLIMGSQARAAGCSSTAHGGVPKNDVAAGGEASQSCSRSLQMRALGKAPGLVRAVALLG